MARAVVKTTSVVGSDGGLQQVEATVFVAQVLESLDQQDRATIERVMAGGKVVDNLHGMRRLRKNLYGRPHGVGMYSKWSSLREAQWAAYRLGFIA